MAISLNSDINSVMSKLNTTNNAGNEAQKLQNRLGNLAEADDKEMLEACKSFESYMLEQVMKNVKEAFVPRDEDKDNEYLDMFGDKLYTEYAELITNSGELGIAQKLYEAMKRDYGGKTET